MLTLSAMTDCQTLPDFKDNDFYQDNSFFSSSFPDVNTSGEVQSTCLKGSPKGRTKIGCLTQVTP